MYTRAGKVIAPIAFLLCQGVGASGATDEVLRLGAELYQRTCSVCHGDSGDGKTWAERSLNPSPENLTSDDMKEHLNLHELIEHVSEGCDQTAMQPFKYQLYEQEIEAIAAHVLINILDRDPSQVFATSQDDDHDHAAHNHDDKPHAEAGEDEGCRPWNLEGVATVAVKGRMPTGQ